MLTSEPWWVGFLPQLCGRCRFHHHSGHSYPVVQRQKRSLENSCRGKSENREVDAACSSSGYREVCQGTAFKAFLMESREMLFGTVPERLCEKQELDQFMLLQACHRVHVSLKSNPLLPPKLADGTVRLRPCLWPVHGWQQDRAGRRTICQQAAAFINVNTACSLTQPLCSTLGM